MKYAPIRLFAFLFFFFSIASSWAIPAFPKLINFQQPNNGPKVQLYLMGDEKVHWAESVDGYTLLYDNEGYFCYAERDAYGDLVPSIYRANDITSRTPQEIFFLQTLTKHLRYSHEQVSDFLSVWNQLDRAMVPQPKGDALIGERRALVILFQTPDCQFSHRKMHIDMLFNQEGFNLYNANGSVRDFYREASNNQFFLHVDVVGPVTGDYDMGYYGGTNEGQYAFAHEAIVKSEGLADFSRYDNDGDGVVDGVHIIFAGCGEEAGAGSDRIWSHQWYVMDAPTFDGVTFGPYSCSPECRGSGGNLMTNIGVICHELGHVFGAPDYYDTDYEGSGGEYFGLGDWDLMSSGSWNDSGRTPARHGAYTTANIYHWTTATELTDPQQVRINQSIGSLDVYRVNTTTNGDYFLLENRQKKGFDRNVPGHGMIVYHVHPNAHGASVSNASHREQLYIMPAYCRDTFPNADPYSYGNPSSASAPYPGRTQTDSLTDNSVPWFRPWSGLANNTPLTSIQEAVSDSAIYFLFRGAEIGPQTLHAHYTDEYTVLAEWQSYGTEPVLLLMSTDSNFVAPDTLYSTYDTLFNGNIVVYNGSAANHTYVLRDTNVAPDTLYFRIFRRINDSTYTEGVTSVAIPYEYDTIPPTPPESIRTACQQLTFNLFPNPARSQVRVECSLPISGLQVTLMDQTGRIVLSRRLGDGIINTEGLPRGCYFLRLTSGGATSVKKLILH